MSYFPSGRYAGPRTAVKVGSQLGLAGEVRAAEGHYVLSCDLHRTARCFVSAEDLRRRSASCTRCRFILHLVCEFKSGWLDTGHEGTKEKILQVNYGQGQVPVSVIMVLVEDNVEIELVGSFSYLFQAQEVFPLKRYDGTFETLDILEDSSTTEAFDRAQKWLQNCLQHDLLCAQVDLDYKPRRLIDIGKEDCNPRLFEPGSAMPYVCLSYCWGENVDSVLTTTRSNIRSHYGEIQLLELPQTIQDAITVCRGLGLSKLWVDSLCIVQDDIESWLQDSSQMKEIYANSYLTIAVEEPSSCQQGFLRKQRFGKAGWQRKIGLSEVVNYTKRSIVLRPSHPDNEAPVNGCSLDKRAWCFQESLLPSRRLCFNGNEMSWECISRRTCECGHSVWMKPAMRYSGLGSRIKHGHMGTLGTPGQKAVPAPQNTIVANPHNDWLQLVEQYSSRTLTRKTDKLTAISGLAKMIMERWYNWMIHVDPISNYGIYHAGLWSATFVLNLGWYVLSMEQVQDISSPYNAPSWSWASVDGAVRYNYSSRRTYFQIRNDCRVENLVSQTILDSDPTGPVKSGHAVLTGQLIPAQMVVRSSILTATNNIRVISVTADSMGSMIVHLDRTLPSLQADPEETSKQELFCFRIHTTLRRRPTNLELVEVAEVTYLLLTRAHKDGPFTRVGLGISKNEEVLEAKWAEDFCPIQALGVQSPVDTITII